MADDIGRTLLEASQVLVQNFQRQQEFQIQRISFEQQLQEAEKLMAMREKELASRDRFAKIQEAQLNAQVQEAARQARVRELAGGETAEAEDVRQTRLAQQLDNERVRAALAGSGTGDQSQLRAQTNARALDLQEQEAARTIARNDARFTPFQNASLKDVRDLRQKLLQAEQNPLDAMLQQQVAKALNLFDATSADQLKQTVEEFETAVRDLSGTRPLERFQRDGFHLLTGSDAGFEEIMLGAQTATVEDDILSAFAINPGTLGEGQGSMDVFRIASDIARRRPNSLLRSYSARLRGPDGTVDEERLGRLLSAIRKTIPDREAADSFVGELIDGLTTSSQR